LGLSDSDSVLHLAMVHLDLPAIKVCLQDDGSRTMQVGSEQERGLAVILALAFAAAIGHGSDHQQAQGSPAAAATPVDRANLFIRHTPPLSAVKDSGLQPGHRFPLADLVRSELLAGIEAAPTRLGSMTEPAVAPCTGHDPDAVQRLAKEGTIAETAIAHGQD